MDIYMDRDMCEDLGVNYHGEPGQVVRKTPAELIVLRGRWKGYDKKHMDFFENFGFDKTMKLTHQRCGWFTVGNLHDGPGGVFWTSQEENKETHLKTLCTCPECGSKFFHWLEGGYDMTEEFLEMEMSTRTCDRCIEGGAL